MKWEVKLYQGGRTFTEEVYANDHQDAKRTALARNPTVDVISVNPIVGESSHSTHNVSSNSNTKCYGDELSSSDSSDVLGYLLLAAIIGVIYVCVTWWYFVIPGAIILGILYYWMKRNNNE